MGASQSLVADRSRVATPCGGDRNTLEMLKQGCPDVCAMQEALEVWFGMSNCPACMCACVHVS